MYLDVAFRYFSSVPGWTWDVLGAKLWLWGVPQMPVPSRRLPWPSDPKQWPLYSLNSLSCFIFLHGTYHTRYCIIHACKCVCVFTYIHRDTYALYLPPRDKYLSLVHHRLAHCCAPAPGGHLPRGGFWTLHGCTCLGIERRGTRSPSDLSSSASERWGRQEALRRAPLVATAAPPPAMSLPRGPCVGSDRLCRPLPAQVDSRRQRVSQMVQEVQRVVHRLTAEVSTQDTRFQAVPCSLTYNGNMKVRRLPRPSVATVEPGNWGGRDPACDRRSHHHECPTTSCPHGNPSCWPFTNAPPSCYLT